MLLKKEIALQGKIRIKPFNFRILFDDSAVKASHHLHVCFLLSAQTLIYVEIRHRALSNIRLENKLNLYCIFAICKSALFCKT